MINDPLKPVFGNGLLMGSGRLDVAAQIPNASLTIASANCSSVIFFATNGKKVIEVKADGRVFWNEVEVVGDEAFKAAMVELRNLLAQRARQMA